jgi:hypothetical protein
VIRKLGEIPELRDRGLTPRFLYALPVSLVGRRDPDPPPMPEAVRAVYNQRVLALLDLPGAAGEGGEPIPHALRLGPEAERLLREFSVWIEPQLDQTGELGYIADWAAKLPGAVVRIAGNLHMAEHVETKAPWDVSIDGETMGRAIRIGHYLISHAHAAFDEMGADPTVDEARHLLAWINRRGVDTFTRRELFEGVKGRFKRVDALQPGLELLSSHGYLRVQPVPAKMGPGRKPSPLYEVNPLARSHKSQDSQFAEGTPPGSAPLSDSATCVDFASGPPADGGTSEPPTPDGEAEFEIDPIDSDKAVIVGAYEEGEL